MKRIIVLVVLIVSTGVLSLSVLPPQNKNEQPQVVYSFLKVISGLKRDLASAD
ncbi:hypothetical protein [Mucilaginibacter sp. SP1R1]|uniref:hypothetical protein n=1 Tax=Mucilaginibacter sp. SP1R1 TaxID=2723091 RepID=UPI0016130D9C|nr:hypothetical protein [Mucilaginibacter sp. SP1R1]MBB6150620.1 hypothetical protein [Mucilaginibacter sp. SP1R1]